MTTTDTARVSGSPFVCSWSGGKDSCLAFYRALLCGGRPHALLTMMTEDGLRTRSHGLPLEVIREQADALGVPSVVCSASWAQYEEIFISALRDFREEGIRFGVFGDLDLERNRAWEEKVCRAAGLKAWLPLWQEDRPKLLREFIDLGFRAIIVAVKADVLSRKLLGRALDMSLVGELGERGVDISGESGEFHTVVTAGPPFKRPISLELKGQELHAGYWFQDVAVV